ncbi:hypothetical protein [Nocardioides sp. T2.26MG-1]|uniref:hypothetical protein n=1 Tax=Nocardioides sp. T2.26MG-1 TaxID=3041166 RepID=UPI002477A8BE|nr:hypothetical protein [Nocardioides sp. T2.26MG-1]CAI9401813.1 hypothetical protein HIDPHFAB_00684 [Nocardioides sp. T2.26MG-1]
MTISGGTIAVDSEGDGIDVNGSLTITGGETTVAGPASDGNAALDVDGSFLVSGGTLVAAGSAGMAMAPSTDSEQGWVQAALGTGAAAGSVVAVLDDSGDELASYTLAKDSANVVVSVPGLTSGETYTVTVDGDEVASVTAGEATGGMGGGIGGGPGGAPGDVPADRGGEPPVS